MSTLTKVSLAAFLVLCAVAGWLLVRPPAPAVDTAPEGGGGGSALIGGPFSLTDHTGAQVSEQSFAGRPTLVFFGFTYCPDVCPTELDRIADLLDALGPAGDPIIPLFISVDPERDTPAVMAEYVAHFHPRIVGLTGSPEQTKQVARAYRVYYAKVEDPDGAAPYTISHSAYIYVMSAAGENVAVIRPDTSLEDATGILRRSLKL